MQPDEIARGLTEASRAALLSGEGTHSAIVCPEMDPLWWLITKLDRDRFHIRLTDTGLAVRAILENKHD